MFELPDGPFMSRFTIDQLPEKYALQAQAQMRPKESPPATLPAPPVKSPKKQVSEAPEWLQSKALHAIPDSDNRSPSGAKPQPAVLHEPLAATQGETLYSGRVHVRITSYRRRLLDPDNLTAKWFLDACRYARLIRDDKPEDITYEVGQEKVARKEDERTEVILEPIP